MIKLHPIPPSLWCVPSALVCITGADWESVIHPALNRHGGADNLLDMVVGSTTMAAIKTLGELGYSVKRYKADNIHSRVKTWAKRSVEKYPGRTFLLMTATHALVLQDGRVYDSWEPHGPLGQQHPFANTPVEACYLIDKP